jgi:hypothetical protein
VFAHFSSALEYITLLPSTIYIIESQLSQFSPAADKNTVLNNNRVLATTVWNLPKMYHDIIQQVISGDITSRKLFITLKPLESNENIVDLSAVSPRTVPQKADRRPRGR